MLFFVRSSVCATTSASLTRRSLANCSLDRFSHFAIYYIIILWVAVVRVVDSCVLAKVLLCTRTDNSMRTERERAIGHVFVMAPKHIHEIRRERTFVPHHMHSLFYLASTSLWRMRRADGSPTDFQMPAICVHMQKVVNSIICCFPFTLL